MAAVAAVEKERPHEAMVFVQKQRCVNHATKKMGTSLRSLLPEYKS